jgi:hypothetical protein
VPARQPEQPLDPATELEPKGQLEQPDAPTAAEYVPAPHAVQTLAPATEYLPAAQSKHTDAPALEAYFPAKHAAHRVLDPVAPNQVPTKHELHTDAPVEGW